MLQPKPKLCSSPPSQKGEKIVILFIFKQNKRLIIAKKLIIYHILQDSIPGLNIMGWSVLCFTYHLLVKSFRTIVDISHWFTIIIGFLYWPILFVIFFVLKPSKTRNNISSNLYAYLWILSSIKGTQVYFSDTRRAVGLKKPTNYFIAT